MRVITEINTVEEFLAAKQKVRLLLVQKMGYMDALELDGTQNLRYNINEALEEIEADLNCFKEAHEKFKITNPEILI